MHLDNPQGTWPNLLCSWCGFYAWVRCVHNIFRFTLILTYFVSALGEFSFFFKSRNNFPVCSAASAHIQHLIHTHSYQIRCGFGVICMVSVLNSMMLHQWINKKDCIPVCYLINAQASCFSPGSLHITCYSFIDELKEELILADSRSCSLSALGFRLWWQLGQLTGTLALNERLLWSRRDRDHASHDISSMQTLRRVNGTK